MKSSVSFALLAMALSSVDATTQIAVVELGKRGAVRRTSSKDSWATVSGVASFWSALHSPGRKLQHAGMPVVPDLFNRGSDGVVIGLKGSGIDFSVMPFVSSLLAEEGKNGVVGHIEVDGNSADALLSKVRDVDSVDAPSFSSNCKRHANSKGLTGMMAEVELSNGRSIDEQLRDAIKALDQEASSAGKTVILHIVVENDEPLHRRMSRRLEDEGEQNQENNENGENADGNNNQNANGQNNGYYGYGYYNSYGEWVTPYKTMFQIQYFNVVLWTAIGLTVLLFFTVYLMLFMPLMPDTLLFGESAKIVGDD